MSEHPDVEGRGERPERWRSATRRGLLVAGLAVLALSGGDTASAFISGNTIDGHATYTEYGGRVRATGPIGCTRGESISISVIVTQSATGARARRSWKSRCTGEIQHWQVRAPARPGARFETGTVRVCAVGRTRSGRRVTDTRTWCRRVPASARF